MRIITWLMLAALMVWQTGAQSNARVRLTHYGKVICSVQSTELRD
jgi:hypothetical protein